MRVGSFQLLNPGWTVMNGVPVTLIKTIGSLLQKTEQYIREEGLPPSLVCLYIYRSTASYVRSIGPVTLGWARREQL